MVDEARARGMVNAYVFDDMTLEQIGRRHQITRERVRQLINIVDPTLYRLAQVRRRARIRHTRVIRDTPVIRVGHCPVCGDTFEAVEHRRVYCSSVHQKIAMMFRYQSDEDFRVKHRAIVANYIVKNADRFSGSQVRYANRLQRGAAGEVLEEVSDIGHRFGTRYVIPGSLIFHWAVRAYVLDWPIFETFHPDVQDQIRLHVSGEPA